jgi:tRNA modification GTPase
VELLDLEGIPVALVDTAGIRESGEPVEQIGVRKAREQLAEGELVLFVVDGSVPFDESDRRIWKEVGDRPYLLVINKEDLPSKSVVPTEVREKAEEQVIVSALKGTNIDRLGHAIAGFVFGSGIEREGAILTSIRHKQCAEKAREKLGKGIEAYREGLSEEFALYDLRKSLDWLGQITGEVTNDEILDQIFRTFCIGK